MANAQGLNQQLDLGREYPYLDQKDPFLGSMVRRIVGAVNQLAANAGVTAVGKTSPPPKIDSINVQGTQVGNTITCTSEILHHTLVHNQAIGKGITYFSEIDTTPSFTQPHVISHGTSRSSFITLPTYSSAANMTATLPTSYYLRSYAQMPGSDPCEPTVLGNLGGPTQIQMGGTSVTALLPSTGSGTAQSSGQQGGQGLGTVLRRTTPQPKRLARRF
jgi:hypothetical protein